MPKNSSCLNIQTSNNNFSRTAGIGKHHTMPTMLTQQWFRFSGCAVIAVVLTACAGGGDSSPGGGGSSSSRTGGNMQSTATGAVVIATVIAGAILIKKWAEKSDGPSPELTAMSLQFETAQDAQTKHPKGNLGFVALSPHVNHQKRNTNFCKNFESASRGNNAAVIGDPDKAHVTVWTLTEDKSKSMDKTDCTQLIERHDYTYSKILINKSVNNQPSSDITGPVLVSYQRSVKTENSKDPENMLVWDLSKIETKDFPLVLNAWAILQAQPTEDLKKII
jgi:hypothetical protein